MGEYLQRLLFVAMVTASISSVEAQVKASEVALALAELETSQRGVAGRAKTLRKRMYTLLRKEAPSRIRVLPLHKVAVIERRSGGDLDPTQLGRLVGADYVLGGRVKKNDVGIELSLQLWATGEEEILARADASLKSVRRGEKVLEEMLARFLAVLDSSVAQVHDTERLPSRQEEAAAARAAQKAAAEAKAIETAKNDVWLRSRNEEPLFDEERRGETAVGVQAGYSLMRPRVPDLARLYRSVFHLGLEMEHAPFPFIAVALASDFALLSGRSVETEALDESVYQTEADIQAATLPESDVLVASNSYFMWGARPMVRLHVRAGRVRFFAGLGAGPHYLKTSGSWRTRMAATRPDPEEPSKNAESITQALYRFEVSHWGMYAVFEGGLRFRSPARHFGAGLVAMYTVLMHGGSGLRPRVSVEQTQTQGPTRVYEPSATDYENVLVRHIASIDMLIFAAKIDWSF